MFCVRNCVFLLNLCSGLSGGTDMENVKNLRMCDKHYVSLTSQGTSLAESLKSVFTLRWLDDCS